MSFSAFPVTFKHFHLLISVYFKSTHMFSKNSSLGLTVSFFVPKSLIVLVSTGLET